MDNSDKFAKTLDDEQLDDVAGGTYNELEKDIAFFKAIKAVDEGVIVNVKEKNTQDSIKKMWNKLGII